MLIIFYLLLMIVILIMIMVFILIMGVDSIRNFALPILLMFGLSLPCYVCTLLMNGIFEKLEKKPD